MSDLPPHDRFPYGLDPERPRPWLDDEPPHHAGDDDDECPHCGKLPHLTNCPDSHCEPDPRNAVVPEPDDDEQWGKWWCVPDEPKRLRCRSCGGIWDEPKLNADGVCPNCVLDLNER